MSLAGKHILLIITGGIAAYKSLELVRLIQKSGGSCQCILTEAAKQFVTPLSVATLSGHDALSALFDLTREAEIGHIELSRSADLIVVAPASAHFLAKMAHGLADDLASTTVLATDTPILVAPAMNVRMWQAASTQRNVAQLRADGVRLVDPDVGPMACGEFGPGRLAEPAKILGAIADMLGEGALPGPLSGRKAVVTSGPTREWIDPIRYISNASSGRQGSAIAAALAALGADVSFVTGPAEAPMPGGCKIIKVQSALEMRQAVMDALPADLAVFSAAVADWRIAEPFSQKAKKAANGVPPELKLVENPDILSEISHLDAGQRPKLVIGFAAETENVLDNARQKFKRKGCDWLLANDVGAATKTIGGDDNQVTLITRDGEEGWPRLSKAELGHKVAEKIATWFG